MKRRLGMYKVLLFKYHVHLDFFAKCLWSCRFFIAGSSLSRLRAVSLFLFILKTHRWMFSVHTAPEKFENATISGHFAFVFEENSVKGITWLSWRHRFRKALFSKCFPSTLKRTFLRFEERFRKTPSSWRIRVDRNPNRSNKVLFSNNSSVVWMVP